MTNDELQIQIAAISNLPFREDYESALYALYMQANLDQHQLIRRAASEGNLRPPKNWRNPTDYDRSDLTAEQKARRTLVTLSIRDGTDDYREDLLSITYAYHTLHLQGFDADAFLHQIAATSAPKFAATVGNFLNSPDRSKLPNWLEIIQTPGGPILARKA
jgi:hypothetical protein